MSTGVVAGRRRAWLRLRALVTVAALVALPARARAQGGPTARVRYLGGYTHELPEVVGTSTHDYWAGVVPELSYLFAERRWSLRATYAFTAMVHTRNPAEIANRLTLISSYELSKRTTLLLSADANQTSLSNYLITRPLLDTSAVVVPTTNSRLLTATASEGLLWEASPSVLFGQGVNASYVTSLDPETRIDNVFVTGLVSLERTWKRDALGVELRGAYTNVDTPPIAAQSFVTITAAPRWRHDLTPTLTSLVSAGASGVVSPDAQTEPVVTPFGRGALLYTLDASSLELSYAGGAAPNVLTGQMLVSHQVTLRGGMSLSDRYRVRAGGSVGYLHGSVLDLRNDAPPAPDVDAFLADVDVTWLATEWMQLFARGLFLAQDNGSEAPTFIREAVIFGLQLSSRSPDGIAIPVRFPQRVDRGDATAQ